MDQVDRSRLWPNETLIGDCDAGGISALAKLKLYWPPYQAGFAISCPPAPEVTDTKKASIFDTANIKATQVGDQEAVCKGAGLQDCLSWCRAYGLNSIHAGT